MTDRFADGEEGTWIRMKTKHLISAVCGTIFKVAVTVLVVIVIYRGAIKAYDYGYRVFAEPAVAAGEGRTVTVAVTEGMSPTEMGEMLESKGLVRDARLFAVQYLLSEFRRDVKPGVYDLSTAMTAEEMLEVMATHDEEDSRSQGNSDTPDTQEDDSGEDESGESGEEQG